MNADDKQEHGDCDCPPPPTPQRLGAKRVHACQAGRRGPGYGSPLLALRQREAGLLAPPAFRRACVRERFAHLRLAAEYDLHRHLLHSEVAPPTGGRAPVEEVLAAEGFIFVLLESGTCVALRPGKGGSICVLNTRPEEVVRSLFYNRARRSLITVSVMISDASLLLCRATPIRGIEEGRVDTGELLFPGEALRWPGFVEFDDSNGKIVTYSAAHQRYCVYDWATYGLLYELPAAGVQEIKLAPGALLLVMARQPTSIPIKLYGIHTGSLVAEVSHVVVPERKVEFIELFNERLFVKQQGLPLTIRNVWAAPHALPAIVHCQFHTPPAFIFLYEKQLFLALQPGGAEVWHVRGRRLARLAAGGLALPPGHTNSLYITADQDLLLAAARRQAPCGASAAGQSAAAPAKVDGCLTVSCTTTGACLAQIGQPSCKGDSADNGAQEGAALANVRALFYDENAHEIYTGTEDGMLHVWAHC